MAGDSGELDRHRFTLFCSTAAHERLVAAAPQAMERVKAIIFPGSSRGYLRRLVEEQFVLPRRVAKEKVDVLFCPGNVLPYSAKVPMIATFQNPVPFCESVTLPSVGLKRWMQFTLLGWFMRATARHADRIVFISEYFRDLMATRYGFDKRRGTVILRSIRELDTQPDEALEQRLGIRRPFLLYVSHLNPYKNVVELIDGFALARERVPGRQLVIAGMSAFPDYKEKIDSAAARLPQGAVLLTGELPHRDALKLMTSCEGFVFPSTCEMCPTALIEALSLGAPTACSNVNVMPEIAGDATLPFDPFDPKDIARVIDTLVNDGEVRERLRSRGRRRASEFPTASEVARRTLEAIEAAAVSPRSSSPVAAANASAV